MLIQLKQSEITAALRDYIVAQGINLSGKTVEISFTAGRKESGIYADISIENAGELPDFLTRDPDEGLKLVSPEATLEPVEEVAVSEEAQEEVPAKKAVSLFN